MRLFRRTTSLVACAVAVVLVAACGTAPRTLEEGAGASDASAVKIENCGRTVAFEKPPTRIVALNSSALENVLALGLRSRVVAADAQRSAIKPELRDEFEGLEVIDTGANSYPSAEKMLENEPEFVYSVYPSAFREDEGIMTREELALLDVATYLSPGRCPDRDMTEPLEFDDVWAELQDLGRLLGVPDRAKEVVAQQRAALERARSAVPETQDKLTVFWWDMGTEQPTAGACCGGPGMIMSALGLENIFSDVEGSWAEVSWEAVIERDPDLVVLADTSEGWEKKTQYVERDETLSQLSAFVEDRVVRLPFSQTTPGLQSIDGIRTISKALRTLDVDQ